MYMSVCMCVCCCPHIAGFSNHDDYDLKFDARIFLYVETFCLFEAPVITMSMHERTYVGEIDNVRKTYFGPVRATRPPTLVEYMMASVNGSERAVKFVAEMKVHTHLHMWLCAFPLPLQFTFDHARTCLISSFFCVRRSKFRVMCQPRRRRSTRVYFYQLHKVCACLRSDRHRHQSYAYRISPPWPNVDIWL